MTIALKPVENAPSSWPRMPLHALGNQNLERNKGLRNDNLLSLSFGTIKKKDIDSNEGLLPESFETYQIVHPGDIIFRFTDLQNDLRSLRSALVTEAGIITSAYLCFRPDSTRVSPHYLNYLMRAYDLAKVFYAFGGGVRQSLKYDEVRNLPIALPPRSLQDSIVEFLDRELAQIDLLVSKQLKLESLLEEKEQGAYLRYLGSPVMSKVPPSVKVQKFKYLLKAPVRSSGLIKGEASREPGDGLIPAFSASGQDVFIPYDLANVSEPGFVLSSVGARCGKTFFADFPHWGLVANTEAWTVDPKHDAKYVWFLTKLPHFWVKGGSAQPYVQTPQSLQTKVFVPELEAQKRIVQDLEKELEDLRLLTQKSEKLRHILEDRRKSLISAAVTGELDIPGAS